MIQRHHSNIATLCLALLAAACGQSPGGNRAGALGAGASEDGRKILRVAYEREIDVLSLLDEAVVSW